MSPKSKAQKNLVNKAKNLASSPATATQNGDEQSALRLSSEDAQRLETEICWCIQQLQIALKSEKLTPKQLQDHTKALNALMNNSTPLVKKRQVMRLSFGDYRAKMAAEEKKMGSANTKIRVLPVLPNKNSVFIKKSLFTSSGGDFHFNFNEPVMNEEEYESRDEPGGCVAPAINSTFRFAPSGNSFRFNFKVD